MSNNHYSFKNSSKNSTCKNSPFYGNGFPHNALEKNKEIQYMHIDNRNSKNKKTKDEEVKIKENVDKSLYEINLLKQIKKTKDMKIAVINREIELMKSEKPNPEHELELYHCNHLTGTETLSSKSDRYQLELQVLRQTKKTKDKKIEAMDEEMQLIKTKSKILACQIESLKNQLEDKVTNLCRQVTNYPITTNMTDVHSKFDPGSDRSINRILFWPVDKVHRMREEGELILSEFFYPRTRPYKLCLSLGSYGDKLEIRLLCYSSLVDSNLPWPFQADISIRIINGITPGISRHITKFRQFSRPPKDLFKSSDRFTFSFPELASIGLLKSDCFVLECFAKLK